MEKSAEKETINIFTNPQHPQTSNTEVQPKSLKMLIDNLDMSVKARFEISHCIMLTPICCPKQDRSQLLTLTLKYPMIHCTSCLMA